MNGRIPEAGDAPRDRRGRGFTLVELLVVMVIISIIMGFILNAALGSVKRAQERATQTLITKLEGGLNDRLDALMQTRPDPNTAHLALAAVYNSSYYPNANLPNNGAMSGFLRAQVIAWYDYIKSELPDVFFVQNTSGPYPINFAGNPYPVSGGTPTDANGLGQYILPLGNSIAGPFYGDGLTTYNQAGTGVFGDSYPAAAGLYKNLGYLPAGYDGVDNNGNGMIDELAEGAPSGSANHTQVLANLTNHSHVAARSEMLYALLVEGRGPLGSVFNRDDFTDQEVKDTDQDGLPEFVDAWGQPLQFFRWPLLYHSDLQRGQWIQPASDSVWDLLPPYQSVIQEREQDPLDLNQQLVAPAWWSSGYNNTASSVFPAGSQQQNNPGVSGGVVAFEYYFHRLTDPMHAADGNSYWDRGATYIGRRAYYSKFLIVSAGLDGQSGVFLYSDTAMSSLGQNASWALIANENNALPFSVNDFADFTATFTYTNGTTITYNPSTDFNDPSNPTSADLLQAAQDDITNQNIQTTVGIGGGK